ncbi:hypothetical protein, partial [Xanthomonas oryzae]|uniref:hypothetical protein n=1 Tax=Xanthomonas oryzae TaxID=347 RepID=UPI001C66FB56
PASSRHQRGWVFQARATRHMASIVAGLRSCGLPLAQREVRLGSGLHGLHAPEFPFNLKI